MSNKVTSFVDIGAISADGCKFEKIWFGKYTTSSTYDDTKTVIYDHSTDTGELDTYLSSTCSASTGLWVNFINIYKKYQIITL